MLHPICHAKNNHNTEIIRGHFSKTHSILPREPNQEAHPPLRNVSNYFATPISNESLSAKAFLAKPHTKATTSAMNTPSCLTTPSQKYSPAHAHGDKVERVIRICGSNNLGLFDSDTVVTPYSTHLQESRVQMEPAFILSTGV